MEINFASWLEQDDHQFRATDPNVDLSLISYQQEKVLLARCRQSGDDLGLVRKIKLPQEQIEYQLEMLVVSNNNRSYIRIEDQFGRNLLVGKKIQYWPKEKKIKLKVKFYAPGREISLKLLIGGDSIALAGNKLMLYYMKLKPVQVDNNVVGSGMMGTGSPELRITKVFETVPDLERAGKANQGRPVQPGEYAILKNPGGDLLYLMKNDGQMVSVCQIGNGLPGFLGGPHQVSPGLVMPVFDNHDQASQVLKEKVSGLSFYYPRNDGYGISDQIYLYLDSKGYVRWLSHKVD